MVDKDLLIRVENVKYRSAGASRSPVGTLSVYQDRVEWTDNASDDGLSVHFNEIRGQRVSPPNKNKIQLQICLYNEDQATFAFLNGEKENQVTERDLVKETLQQSLIHHRKAENQAAARFQKSSKALEMETKKKILEGNKHLQLLYKHLVASKLIPAQDFWCEYYNAKEDDEEKLGVSGGFLSSIAQSEGTNGVKLNINVDTIQSIFKTYPAVEKKHLELVPHELTEQQFWAKFFQSHYFHRQRAVNPNPADPFSECLKLDDIDMHKMLDGQVSRKALDFSYLSDDNTFLPPDDIVPVVSSSSRSAKALLVRRCNYHSGRVLMTIHEGTVSEASNEAQSNCDENNASSSSAWTNKEDLIMESEGLHDTTHNEEIEKVNIADRTSNDAVRRYSPEQTNKYTTAVLNHLERMKSADMDVDIADDEISLLDALGEDAEAKTCPLTNLDTSELEELYTVHDTIAELLKHFWMCFPPITPELEEKLDRMDATLKRYKDNQLAEAQQKFGARNVAHCYDMLDLAFSRYETYLQKRKR